MDTKQPVNLTLYSATFITDHDIRLYRFDTVIMDYKNIYIIYDLFIIIAYDFFIFTPYPLQKRKTKTFQCIQIRIYAVAVFIYFFAKFQYIFFF